MEKAENKKNGTFKYHMAEVTKLPKDVILGVPIVTITGNSEINIENYRGLIEYKDSFIRVKVKNGQICITGKELQIQYYLNDDMKIYGRIETIEYQ